MSAVATESLGMDKLWDHARSSWAIAQPHIAAHPYHYGVLLVLVVALVVVVVKRTCKRPVRSLQVLDRETGKLVDEHVPAYLKAVYQAMYSNRVGRKAIKLRCTNSLLRRSTARQGKRMDRTKSAKSIQKFIRAYGLNPDEAELPLHEYKTFNEFFARRLKPGLRPIASPDDPSVIVSPADCRLLVYPSLDLSCDIWLKGEKLSLLDLLGEEFAAEIPLFGSHPPIAIARLAPSDYHRWHMPVDAVCGKRALIAGTYLSVSPRAVTRLNVLGKNKREVCLLHSSRCGLVALVAVGASLVSSITIVGDEGMEMNKGDEHGYFQFGGSTLLLIFQQGRMVFDGDLVYNSARPLEMLVKMGTKIGMAVPEGTSSANANVSTINSESKVTPQESFGAGLFDCFGFGSSKSTASASPSASASASSSPSSSSSPAHEEGEEQEDVYASPPGPSPRQRVTNFSF